MELNFFKKHIHILVILSCFSIIFFTPCYYYGFMEPYLMEIKILCVLLIYYGSTLGLNNSLFITLTILLLFYKIHKLCGITDNIFS